jgi:rod shape-determining protein MreB and related proteins
MHFQICFRLSLLASSDGRGGANEGAADKQPIHVRSPQLGKRRRVRPQQSSSVDQRFFQRPAIDLGTVNTRVYARGRGIVVNEPSAVAIHAATREVEAVGKEAWEMIGRTPAKLAVIKPMKNGVIADFTLAQAMLEYFIHKAHTRTTLVHPGIVISVPSDITQVERRAVMESAYRARASEVHLVEQAMMAAVGAGLPVSKPGGNMIVDIGGGTTDIAVISLSGIVYARSLRIAGNHMDEAIAEHVRRKHALIIGERTAEKIKVRIGSAARLEEPRTMEAKGRDLMENVPKSAVLDDCEIRAALDEPASTIVSAIRGILERIPPELSGDIGERGIVCDDSCNSPW